MANELSLDILGTSFTISADEDEDYLQKILTQYRAAVENTQNISGITDNLNVAVLTGFLLCDEINKMKLHREGVSQEVEKRTLNLIAKLDRALKHAPDNGNFYRLRNQIKHYAWGSQDFIPAFLNIENREKKPWAEMWMGTHPGAPSQAATGEKLAELAGGQLPFLFKLLAAGKPLSIQAHPDLTQAQKGFKRENEAGLAQDDPGRNYKDPNHKPEILCALVPFTVMAGFRRVEEILKFFEAFLSIAPAFKDSFSPLLRALDAGSLQNFFHALFGVSQNEREKLSAFLVESDNVIPETASGPVSVLREQWHLMRYFAAQYPGDPAVLSPLYLNLFTLEPGQAIFVPAGVLHAYISGFGIELMASSDNVLRGGLTPKHVDIPELMNVLDFKAFMPEIICAPPSPLWFRFPAPCKEFSLSLMCGNGVKRIFPENGPAICIVTGGELQINGAVFKKGESFFIPQDKGSVPLYFSGNYSLFVAAPGVS